MGKTFWLVVYLPDNRRLRVLCRRLRVLRRRRLDGHQRHVIDVDFGLLGFLFLTLLFLAQAQLLAVALEFSGTFRLLGGRVLACQAVDRDTRIQAIRIGARFGGFLVALHEHAVEKDPILHEIGHRHGRNSLGPTGRHTQRNGSQAPAGDDGFVEYWHIASQQQCYPKPVAARPCGCDASHDLTNVYAWSYTASAFDPAEAHVYRSLAMPPAKAKSEPMPDFETAMRDLEELVARLEQGDLPLEESLAAFERGVMLTRACQSALKEAEQKVEILLKKAGESAVEDFTPDET